MLRHQVLTLLTDKIERPTNTVASSIQSNGRSRLPSIHVRIAASSSLIFCSAMLIHTELQATGSESTAQPCNPALTPDASNGCQSTAQQRMEVAPEPALTQQWSQSSPDKLPKEVETTYSELLNQAQAAASRDQLTTAVDTVAGIPKNSQHYELAQQLEAGWSQELVRQAASHFHQAEVATAIAMVEKIPATSQWRDRGIEMKQQWQQQAKLFNRARSAKSVKDWQGTINAIKAMEGLPLYNSLPVQELLQQALINRYEPDPMLLKLAAEDAPIESIQPAQEVAKLVSR